MFYWFIAGIAAVVAGGVGALSYLATQRRNIAYPPPESLVITPDTDLIAERDADNNLVVRWADPEQPARIYVRDAVTQQNGEPITIDGGGSSTIIGLAPGRRHYFDVVFTAADGSEQRVTVAERTLQLEGAVNFRDLGGYPTTDGRRVRWGQVYRSGRLSELTANDVNYLHALGIQMVCDLRADEEISIDPDLTVSGIQYQHIPLNDTASQWERLFALLFNPAALKGLMRKAYTRTMIDDNAPVFGSVLTRISDPDNRPTIVHCTAGKDRAGLTSALLLLHLGVPDEVVIADYTLSNRDYATFRAYTEKMFAQLSNLRISVDDLYPLLTADAETMRMTIDHIRTKYGTVTDYLRDHARVPQDALDRLRADLLK